jgi:hypothetical protein
MVGDDRVVARFELSAHWIQKRAKRALQKGDFVWADEVENDITDQIHEKVVRLAKRNGVKE